MLPVVVILVNQLTIIIQVAKFQLILRRNLLRKHSRVYLYLYIKAATIERFPNGEFESIGVNEVPSLKICIILTCFIICIRPRKTRHLNATPWMKNHNSLAIIEAVQNWSESLFPGGVLRLALA